MSAKYYCEACETECCDDCMSVAGDSIICPKCRDDASRRPVYQPLEWEIERDEADNERFIAPCHFCEEERRFVVSPSLRGGGIWWTPKDSDCELVPSAQIGDREYFTTGDAAKEFCENRNRELFESELKRFDADPSLVMRTNDNWIQTHSGKQFWPLNPIVSDIEIEDVATALGNKCRYTGHAKNFYSVAQHSVLVSQYCDDAKWGLMHDAAEAYLPDVAKPIKSHLPGFREIEDRLMKAIAERFGLPWPVPESVWEADRRMYATEERDVMPSGRREWPQTKGVEPYPERIKCDGPGLARIKFLKRFRELF